jgi:O-methyltransferase
MASWWSEVELSDCEFYHRVRLANGATVDGHWNLIGGEEEYLGAVTVESRRVLELGPATGWLTAWLEQQGASVVCFDVGWDLCQDLMPLPDLDLADYRLRCVDHVCRIQNSWWYLRRDHRLSAQVVYGSIYDLPDDIGRFDMSILGCILLHLRDPFRALEQAARRTEYTIVIVEPFVPELLDRTGTARWNPTNGENPTGWWYHSPSVITDMLTVLGFGDVVVSYHRQPYKVPYREEPHHFSPLFTAVARRDRAAP